MASLNLLHKARVYSLSFAYIKNGRQLVAEAASPPAEGAAFSASLTFKDPAYVFISINTVTFTCRADARLADL